MDQELLNVIIDEVSEFAKRLINLSQMPPGNQAGQQSTINPANTQDLGTQTPGVHSDSTGAAENLNLSTTHVSQEPADNRGVPWHPDFYAANKAIKADGSWRMRKGAGKPTPEALAAYEAPYLGKHTSAPPPGAPGGQAPENVSFTELVQKVTNLVTNPESGVTTDDTNAVLANHNIYMMGALMPNKDGSDPHQELRNIIFQEISALCSIQ